jgi:hypothetical protein
MRDKIYDLVSASSLLPEACQQWRMHPKNDKNWDNACQHFKQSASDRDQVQTAGGAGFHTNHIELALAPNAEIPSAFTKMAQSSSKGNAIPQPDYGPSTSTTSPHYPTLSNMLPCLPSQQRLSGNVLLFYIPAPDPLQSPHSEKPSMPVTSRLGRNSQQSESTSTSAPQQPP